MRVCEPEALEEPVLVGDELAMPLMLGKGVPAKELEDVSVAEGEDVKELDALRKLAILRPRYVMEDTAASASPASHSVDS